MYRKVASLAANDQKEESESHNSLRMKKEYRGDIRTKVQDAIFDKLKMLEVLNNLSSDSPSIFCLLVPLKSKFIICRS